LREVRDIREEIENKERMKSALKLIKARSRSRNIVKEERI
jgi:hypothetical protein